MSKDRIFLVGNGPSLKHTPLELLKGEDTMGMNAIDLIYGQTTWRPKYYYCIDVNENDKHWKDAIKSNLNCEKVFLWDGWKNLFQGKNIEWIHHCQKHHFYSLEHPKRMNEWHLPTLCTAIGSMSAMMQLSVLMGYKAIYLIGCDLFDGPAHHFRDDYPNYSKLDYRTRLEFHLHEIAHRSSPVPIYNATMGGTLEVHPRVDFMSLFNGA